MIDLVEPVTLSFALRYFNSFSKATPLFPTVTLRMSKVGAQRLRQIPTLCLAFSPLWEPMACPACAGLTLSTGSRLKLQRLLSSPADNQVTAGW